MKTLRNTRGFTLIELLVVIAIIAILAAILFPVFARAKEAAKKIADLSNLKQLATATAIYGSDYDDTFISFPYAGQWSGPAYTNREKGQFWTDKLMPYVKAKQMYNNPGNTDTVYDSRGYWLPGATSAATLATDPSVYRVTFAMNHMLNRGDKGPDNPGATSQTAVDEPAQIALMGPSQYAWTFSSCQPDSAGSQNMSFYWLISDAGWGYELFGNKGAQGGWSAGANFSYADGHAKYQKAVDGGTATGDLYGYQGRDLFRGYFPGAKTRANVSTNGTCPSDRGSMAY